MVFGHHPIATTAFTSARNFTSSGLPTAFTGLIGENYGFWPPPPSRPRLSLALGISPPPAAHGFHGLNRGELWLLATTSITTTAFTNARNFTPPPSAHGFHGLNRTAWVLLLAPVKALFRAATMVPPCLRRLEEKRVPS